MLAHLKIIEILKDITSFSSIFRPKSGNDDRILQIALDGTQGIVHAKAKVLHRILFIYILHVTTPTYFLSCARRWRCRATPAACTSSSALPAKLPPPTRSRREHSGGQWTRWGGWELVVIVSLPMPISSACWRARPKKDRRHVPVLRGWQQDSILPPLGIH